MHIFTNVFLLNHLSLYSNCEVLIISRIFDGCVPGGFLCRNMRINAYEDDDFFVVLFHKMK